MTGLSGPNSTIVIVGGGLAGLRAAETVRSAGHAGPIVMLGHEPHLPYDRPPLSKEFLAGKWGADRIMLRPPDKIAALDLDLRLGHTAVALDVVANEVHTEGGGVVPYHGLVIATGAQPRVLPGASGLSGVYTLRTLDDSVALASRAAVPGARVAVVGAGFIGSEVAATCRSRGADVALLEALPAPLALVLGEEMGEACGDLHADHGVDLRTGAAVSAFLSHDGGPEDRPAVAGVELADGSVVDADVVVVGIGVVPTTKWLEGSGLELANGVVADSTLHAADDVVVAGDVACWYDDREDRLLRVEHWTNATEQGVAAARSLLAGRHRAAPFVTVPYVWSDQYDVKIQLLGLPDPTDDVVIVEGSRRDRRFVALYGRGGRLTAALGFGRPRQLMAYRSLLESGAGFDEALARARA